MVSASSRGCVLYILQKNDVTLPGKLALAQAYASKRSLPLAAVGSIVGTPSALINALQRLGSLEKSLGALRIPLIVLIGESHEVINNFSRHVRPARTFTDRSSGKMESLTSHPIPWPGKVLSITELIQLVKTGQVGC